MTLIQYYALMDPKGCNRENGKVIYDVTEIEKIVG